MKTRTRYVFSAAVAGVALSGIPAMMHLDAAHGATIGLFTFEGLQSTAAGSATTGANFGPYSADSGTGTAFGVHAGATTVYSPPAGNGSPHSLSSNVWLSGDYYEFDVPTTTYQNIVVSFDQTSSATGPHAYRLFYSTDGTNYSSFSNYSVLTNAAGTTGTVTAGAWNSTGSFSAYNFLFDLSAVTALNNDSNAKFRLQDVDTTTATGGTDRVDNFLVVGDAASTPEPASVSLMTAAAAMLLRRRRNA